MPLISRRSFPPNGWKFFEPRTGWNAQGGMDFSQVVDAIIKHRKANPRFTDWALDMEDVANELDAYTCQRLNNDPNYCDGGDSPPFQRASLSFPSVPRRFNGKGEVAAVGVVSKTAAGIGLLLDWLGSGGKAVEKELAEKRAAVCAGCDRNKEKTLTSIFTIPASQFIQRQLAIKNDMKLETSQDLKLGVCETCTCPLKLKVWTPMEHVLKHTSEKVMAEFPEWCWVRNQDK